MVYTPTGTPASSAQGSSALVRAEFTTISTELNDLIAEVQLLSAQVGGSAVTPTDGVFLVGDGSEFVGESGATARASLELVKMSSDTDTNNAGRLVTVFNSDNVPFGYGGLSSITSGTGNVSLGKDAGGSITTTNDNLFIGDGCGSSATGVAQGIYIGANVVPTNSATGETIIGNSGTGNGTGTTKIWGGTNIELDADTISLNSDSLSTTAINLDGNTNIVGDTAVNGQIIIEQELYAQGSVILQKNLVNFTASTTQTQGQTPVSGPLVFVTTCANANDVITLEDVSRGMMLFVKNLGAQTLQIFPASGESINGQAANASITLASGVGTILFGFSATEWHQLI